MQTLIDRPTTAPTLSEADFQLAIDPTRRMTPEDVAKAVSQPAATVRKWIRDGAYGHKLHTVLAGGHIYTSMEHVREFFAAVTHHAR